ncbi:NAD kinase-like isoform X2 [Xyrichtys novacula]|uniref:NAD kinase-like isoform X2 n=1 Tax=Xyrichtys novacula TaxID=13765 RepID=A0AAV1GVT5_XYRNO|nr:NAD kinase-like isoform X2 [Xyrichtys novacula]
MDHYLLWRGPCMELSPPACYASNQGVFAGIAPAGLRREAATLALARKAQRHDWHILHNTTTTAAPPSRLKSRLPDNKAEQEMLNSTSEDISRDAFLAVSWTLSHPSIHSGRNLPQSWATLSRLRTGLGRFKTPMRKWGMVDSAACECDDPEQTSHHKISTCPLYRPPSEASLFDLGPEMLAWQHDTELDF